MKKIYLFAVMLISLLFFSCKDYVTYEDEIVNLQISNGPPVIKAVSPVTDRESDISDGELDQLIIIKGENLVPLQSLSLNNIELDLKQVYAISSEVVIKIPRVLPENKNDKIILTTNKGSFEYNFLVSIPALRLDGASYEFASAGDTITLIGDYFDLWEVTEELGSITMNQKALEIIEAKEKSVSVIIPKDYDSSPTRIEVNSPKLSSPVSVAFNSMGNVVCRDEIKFEGNFSPWSWNTSDYLKYVITNQDIIDNPADYFFKFEINTEKPINVLGLHFYIAFGPDNVYSWNTMLLDNGGAVNTAKKWETKRIRMTDFSDQSAHLVMGENDFVILYSPHDNIDAGFTFKNFRIDKK